MLWVQSAPAESKYPYTKKGELLSQLSLLITQIIMTGLEPAAN
jgi:hypothetical protein